MNNNFVVIMAGGVGSRFWPVSRTTYPKQFLDVLGTGKSLIQSTYDRFLNIVDKENIFIVTNDLHIPTLKEQLPLLTDQQILGEPMMRNTAPCIAYACYKIFQLNPEAQIVVAPADHLILNERQFTEDVHRSLAYSANQDALLTLGIMPSRPDTGYGYIKYDQQAHEGTFKKVSNFTEKPDLKKAKGFLADGAYLWNSGIFIWSAKSIISSFQMYQPNLDHLFQQGEMAYNTPQERLFIDQIYSQCENISIDFAILEKADNVYVLPVDFGWSDLGTWASIYELASKDEQKNVLTPQDRVIMRDSTDCLVHVPQDKLVVLQGLHDYIIVEANNTLMICPRAEEQRVKEIVADVKNQFGATYI